MMIVIEHHWSPDDWVPGENNYVRYLGTGDTIDEAIGLIRPRFDEVWFYRDDVKNRMYEMMVGDIFVENDYGSRESMAHMMGDAIGCVQLDNEHDIWRWMVFDEGTVATVCVL